MVTNNFPGVKYISIGKDYNFFQSASITTTSFGGGSVDGYQPDMLVTFSTTGVVFTNETVGQIVEYSFNGRTVHGQLDGTTTSTTRSLTFQNRAVSLIWFRLKSGSAGPATVTVTAWAK